MGSPQQYATDNSQTFREQLFDLLRIPSVSTDPAYKEKVKEAANWLVDDLNRIGLSAELIETANHPLVYAEWMNAGDNAKTILFYGHYDVQPAVKEDGWDTEPFDPTVKNDVVYARGSTDDKGQMFIHLKAVEAFLQSGVPLPCNVKFILEGEEESGGESIAKYISENAEKLKADVCVVSDTSMASMDEPVIINGLRGIVGFEITVTGPSQDLHSGMYGGTVHNPVQALAEIIAQLHDDAGRITVPGFYDNVRELTAEDRQAINATEWDNIVWAKDTGAPLPWGEADFTLLERIGARPTLDINGFVGGYYGEGSKSIIPAKATAKITCRLVADQDPVKIEETVVKHLKNITPPTVKSDVKVKHTAVPAALVDITNPAITAAITAYEEAWGAKPIFKREGGSIPVVGQLQRELNMPVVLMGFGLNTDGLHGPNEHFSLKMFDKGILTTIRFIQEYAKV